MALGGPEADGQVEHRAVEGVLEGDLALHPQLHVLALRLELLELRLALRHRDGPVERPEPELRHRDALDLRARQGREVRGRQGQAARGLAGVLGVERELAAAGEGAAEREPELLRERGEERELEGLEPGLDLGRVTGPRDVELDPALRHRRGRREPELARQELQQPGPDGEGVAAADLLDVDFAGAVVGGRKGGRQEQKGERAAKTENGKARCVFHRLNFYGK